MATFDAGSIEASLTLDRSPFNEGLRLAKQEAAEFAGKPITATLNLDGEDKLTILAAKINELDGRNIGLNIDDMGAMLQLELLQREIKHMDGENIDINVDTGEAEAEIGLLQLAMDKLKATGEGGGGPSLMMTAIIALAPIAVAAVVPLAAVLGGLATGFALAGAGAGILALGIVPLVKGFTEQKKALLQAQKQLDAMDPTNKKYAAQQAKVKQLQDGMTKQYGPMSKGISTVLAAFHKFQDEIRPEAMVLISRALSIVAKAIPPLAPLFIMFGKALSPVLDHMDEWVKGPGYARFIEFIGTYGPKALTSLIGIMTNLGAVVGHTLAGFGGFSGDLLGSLVRITGDWAKSTQNLGANTGFQNFLAYARTEGPVILKLLGDLTGAVVQIARGISPLAPVTIAIADAFAKMIAHTPAPVITAIAAVVIPLVLGMKAWAAIQPIVTAGMWLLSAAMDANPIGLVVIAIAALAAGFAVAWNKSEVFRDIVMGVFDEMKLGALGMAYVLLTQFKYIGDIWLATVGQLVDGGAAAFGWLPGIGPKLKKAAKEFDTMRDSFGTSVDAIRDKVGTELDKTWKETQIRSALLAVAISTPLEQRLPLYQAIADKYGTTLEDVLDSAHLQAGEKAKLIALSIQQGIDSQTPQMKAIAKAIAALPAAALKDSDTRTAAIARATGQAIADGIKQGISDRKTSLLALAGNLGATAANAARHGAQVFSPSRLTIPVGHGIADGITVGIKARQTGVLDAARRLGQSAASATSSMTASGSGRGGGSAGAIPTQQGTVGSMRPPVHVTLYSYNPVAESTSQTAVKQMNRLAELGVFSG